ncbi:5'-3' exonuclease, partial [Marinicrinis sediminis]
EESRGIRRPSQIIDLKALMGDASDNIPGCPGVGPKTALKLIAEYDSLDQVYAHIDEIKGKLKERLIANREQVYLSYELASIMTDVPLQCELDQCQYSWNQDKLIPKLEEFEFKSIIRSIMKGIA